MRIRPSHALAVMLTLALVLGAVGVIQRWRESRLTDLERAVGFAPAQTQRASWTDWRAVRREVGARRTSDPEKVQSFLDAAFTRDLSTSSALVESSPVLTEEFGFSPATLVWELFAQSPDGAVDILGFPDDADFDALADRLEDLGFEPPEDASGVWSAGPNVLARIGPQLTPELQHFALLPDESMVLTSDTASYLESALDVVSGDADGVADEAIDEVAENAGTPLTAAIFAGDYACEHLAMAGADETDQAQADELISQAGDVHPMTAFAMSAQPNGTVVVGMTFENDDVARTDADSRAALASGPAPGQGGDFTDRFAVESATARGRLVRLVLAPVEGEYVVSDLTSGPLLFATC